MSEWFKENLDKLIMIWWTITLPLTCLVGMYLGESLSNHMLLLYVSLGIGTLFAQNFENNTKGSKSK